MRDDIPAANTFSCAYAAVNNFAFNDWSVQMMVSFLNFAQRSRLTMVFSTQFERTARTFVAKLELASLLLPIIGILGVVLLNSNRAGT